jgi:hypothetical protein
MDIRPDHGVALMDTPCWIWPRSIGTGGYGQYLDKFGKMQRPRRTVYEHIRGQIPEGMQLDHLCRVRACVSPFHLEIVTNRENCQRGIRSMQTKCLHGHLYTPETTRYRTSKFGTVTRGCKTCQAYADSRRPSRGRDNAVYIAVREG